jgi:hypothetical protein
VKLLGHWLVETGIGQGTLVLCCAVMFCICMGCCCQYVECRKIPEKLKSFRSGSNLQSSDPPTGSMVGVTRFDGVQVNTDSSCKLVITIGFFCVCVCVFRGAQKRGSSSLGMFDVGAPEFRRHSSRNIHLADGAHAGVDRNSASDPRRPAISSSAGSTSRTAFHQQPSPLFVSPRQGSTRTVLHAAHAKETEMTRMRNSPGNDRMNPVGPGGVFQPGYSGDDAAHDGGYAVPYHSNEGMMITYVMPDGRPVPGPPQHVSSSCCSVGSGVLTDSCRALMVAETARETRPSVHCVGSARFSGVVSLHCAKNLGRAGEDTDACIRFRGHVVFRFIYGVNDHTSNATHSKEGLDARHGLENVPHTPLVPAFRSSSCANHTTRR